MDQQTAQDIGAWIARQDRRGMRGLKLYTRLVTERGTEIAFLDEYVISPTIAADVVDDIDANARGMADPVVTFILRAFADGADESTAATRSVSVVRSPITLGAHEPDRYATDPDATIRLLLQQVHESHKVITQVLPAVLAHQSQIIGAMAQPITTMAETQDAAIKELRESRAMAAAQERQLLDDAARNKRLDQLYELAGALVPQIIASLPSGGDNKG